MTITLQRISKLFLIAVLLLGVLFSAAARGEQEEGAEVDTTKPMVITWLDRAENNDMWFTQYMEEKFNVDIQFNGIHPNENERVQVMLASGEFPDVGMLWGEHSGSPVSLYEEGVTRVIPHTMVRRYAPNIAALYDKFPLGWLKNTNPENREEFVSLNGVSETTNGINRYITFRADWAQKLGFEMPNYEEERVVLDRFGRNYYYDHDYTWAELEELLYLFRDGDPDGNGQNDTIPFLTNKDIYRYWGPLMGAFGYGNGSNFEFNMLNEQGELIMEPISPHHKEFIKVMNKWYEEGLMDREFVTLDYWKSVDKIASEKVGAFSTNLMWTGRSNLMNRNQNVGISEEEIAEGKHYVMIPPPIGPDGYRGTESYSSIAPYRNYNFQVNENVSDAKLARILKVLDWFRGTKEGMVFSRFGKPGVHFDWQGEPWESAPIAREVEDVPSGYPKTGGTGMYPTFNTKEIFPVLFPKLLVEAWNNIPQSDKMKSMEYHEHRHDIFGETDYEKVKERVWATLTTHTTEFFFGGITGSVDVDAEWDAYVQKWYDLGGRELLDELEKAPLVESLRLGEIKY